VHIVVFWEEDFPYMETCAVTHSYLRSLIEEEDTLQFADSEQLPAALQSPAAVLLLPYGSAFPKAAWPALYDFLNRGGNWVNLGGSPLSRPVRKNQDGSWHVEIPTTAYTKELRINQAFPIELTGEEALDWEDRLFSDLSEQPTLRCARAWSLQVRFTDMKDFPREHGSSGTRDATLRAQLYAYREERPIAAPIVLIDRQCGSFAGGRWLLINAELTEPLDPALLRNILRVASEGAFEFTARPTFACFYPGEQPSLLVRVRSHRLRGEARLHVDMDRDSDSEAEIDLAPVWLNLEDSMPRTLRIPLDSLPIDFTPGFYALWCTLELPTGGVESLRVGFWVYDEELLTGGHPLTVNRDYFERDGEPYPVLGTTYMAGDTHRKFLFEPNPAVWDRDFAAMRAAGVNMVRTGLWTAWKRVMLDPGAVDEGVLRAFTAFLLTARAYDIPITFNFFAFWPEEWGGSNPYLDPRAISAQQELVAAFAHRFAEVDDLIWDFINEPSATSPAQVWSCRPNYDTFERTAWAKWLRERARNFTSEEQAAENPEEVWRERWRLTPNDPLDLPALEDFHDQHIFQGTHPTRVLDYRLFAQEVFNNWVRQMTAPIRANGNPHQMITVGQDEGGIGDRPNPHFFADVVDFTTNHTWWQNDDLIWDSVMTKTPGKPNLSQETGIMFYENLEGGYWYSPEDAANLLARKLLFAFAAGCAGAIQWLWNTNVYMDSDNEVGIGFHRADGTEKPELEVFRGVARFFRENRQYLKDRVLESTVVVIPHSNMFSVRNTADVVTRRVIHYLEYTLGIPTRTVSEYRMEQIGEPACILLPSPRILTQACWEALLAKVEAGATLIV
jgi:hypothetical protein